jgi:hypothetical protein
MLNVIHTHLNVLLVSSVVPGNIISGNWLDLPYVAFANSHSHIAVVKLM